MARGAGAPLRPGAALRRSPRHDDERRPVHARVRGRRGGRDLRLLAGRAVLERPAHVATEAVVDATLRDQRRDDHQAAVAKAEAVVHPGAAGGVDRLLAEAAAEALLEPGSHLVAVDAELAGIRVQPPFAAPGAHRPTGGW